jgi:hypothetical protein
MYIDILIHHRPYFSEIDLLYYLLYGSPDVFILNKLGQVVVFRDLLQVKRQLVRLHCDQGRGHSEPAGVQQ